MHSEVVDPGDGYVDVYNVMANTDFQFQSNVGIVGIRGKRYTIRLG